MKYRELRKLFEKAGWELIRQRSSHQTWGKGTERETLAGKDSDDVPKGLLNHLLRRIGHK
ncbi:type II toxin-antitoxin system HicA family toxin [Deinococcus soli (ex Cha et al. 2016)]|uniref:RNA binding protein YcfA (HicA-like mRNA interferase family) n=1 Tax=Deinococcus soli (ex Cha et al. 2016) TaxID=1309411 RepID=A0ACC6KPK2_9DEIO|nr:putative RNA binding protein YcfA (HicA-like mRNA interferase family) [Deinococcus soli (ex Cha et al. 2016)]MDR6754374.1 putative RNA binding protein YcfA (HicA-like mRNA interferase family) [Deinococcus soli (ex Cha et al. 2016)]